MSRSFLKVIKYNKHLRLKSFTIEMSLQQDKGKDQIRLIAVIHNLGVESSSFIFLLTDALTTSLKKKKKKNFTDLILVNLIRKPSVWYYLIHSWRDKGFQ